MKFILTYTVATLSLVATVALAQTTSSQKDPPTNPNDRKKSAWDNLPTRPQHAKEAPGAASAPLSPKSLAAPVARAAAPVPAPGPQIAGSQLGKAAAPSARKPLSSSGKQSEGQTEDDLYVGARKQVRPASGSAVAPAPRPAPSGQRLLALPTPPAPQTQSQQPPVPAPAENIKTTMLPRFKPGSASASGGNSGGTSTGK